MLAALEPTRSRRATDGDHIPVMAGSSVCPGDMVDTCSETWWTHWGQVKAGRP